MAIFGRAKRGRHSGESAAEYPSDASDNNYGDDYYADNTDYTDEATYRTDRADDGYYDESGDEYDGDGPMAGPYDEHEVSDDGVARLDLGSVRLPLPQDAQVQVEMEPSGQLRAVHVLTPNGRFTIAAYAAPKSGELWPEISRELSDQLHGDGARVRREYGEWGAELVAFVNDVLLRFVGVDGPRWMLRGVSAGPKETSAKAAEELRDIVRGAVVVRGDQPMPVRTPLPLSVPDEIAQYIEQAKTTQAEA